MSRRWIAKLNRAFCSAIVETLVLAAWASVQAAPLAYIRMEGRRAGTTDPFSFFVITPIVGEAVEYRLVADMAPVGTTNGNWTINTLVNSGLQSLSLAIVQSPTDTTQFDFNIPPPAAQVLRNGWGDGTGASSGVLSPRPGGSWNDIRGIRPIHAPGVFSAVDPEVILQGGTFTVASLTRDLVASFARPTWGTGSGAMRINGVGQIFITPNDQAGPDPLVAFEPLVIGPIPEPSTVVLAAFAATAILGFVICKIRRSRRPLSA
jgi:hypothetical protein